MHHHEHGRGDCGRMGRRGFRFGMGGRGFEFSPGRIHIDFGEDFPFGGMGGGRGRGPGGPRGPRGRRGRMFGSGELRLVLLKLIADEPRHGYDLIRAMEEMTGGEYAPSPGVVYPTLTMLLDMGQIEEQATEGARKRYATTDDGRAELESSKDEVEALFARLEEAKPQRHGHPNLGRAVGNLMHALKNRVAHGGWNDELVHEVTAILDEAAQRIERLG
ncbi:PadR family transcriptional regulator [Sphingomonas ginkgonis]|uniref:PadR family transcriptional regulator n=1 Tax=Sphingomonas ginkgonis TaxID=2315330 RepID=A0A3R9Y735_9SPHN|nr:PadR family transcriptional regulator [Sphingomonas ginkgonis]RST31600.1 PadR family transcriptional regulator [Sphingomonas ginkgonis]